MGMFALSTTPVTVLDQLVNQCCDAFLQKVVFLRDVPVLSFVQSPRPQYLTLALAAMGSLLAGDASEVSASYWQDSVHLMTGRLEIDNREARDFNLLKAVSTSYGGACLCINADTFSGCFLRHTLL